MNHNFFAVALAILASLWITTPAQSDVISTNWFSNATTIENVIDPPGTNGPERLRLQGGFNTGFVEGVVPLPSLGDWSIEFFVRTDSNFDIPEEFVDIFIDDVFVQRVYNTPPATNFDIQHQVTGDHFDYRFEFSSPSVVEHAHLIVHRGTATNVPYILGDVNCDGVVNLLDVAPFVEAISSSDYNAIADINEDGEVNLLDVGPFVDLMAGG